MQSDGDESTVSAGPGLEVVSAIEDRYRIDREIGVGGMATVYRARDLKHDRDVAIKMLRPELSALLGADRFLSEIKTTAALQHPHILPLFDSGMAGGRLFYVMPLVTGETLRSRLTREHQLPVADAVRIATEIASALDYAHRHGIVHRDIKPENILLHEGSAMVADFGISLAVQQAAGERMTQTGLSLGTPLYMSPEQAMGEKALTARSDIYALGVVMYEMLTGDVPFTGSTAQMIVARVISEEPRAIIAQRKHVPESVEAAVLTALEKLPADRFASAGEFAKALADPVSGAVAFGNRRHARDRRLAWASAGVVMILTGAAAFGGMRYDRVAPVVTTFELPLPRGVTPLGDQAAGTHLAISPDGRVVVWAADTPEGTRFLYARSLDDLRPRIVEGTENAEQPFFSQNGRLIGFWSDDKIRTVAVEGGASQPIVSVKVFRGASWNKDNVIVYGGEKLLYSIPGGGGTPTLLAEPDTARGEVAVIYPVALPDGDLVLYSSRGNPNADSTRIGIASISGRFRAHTLDVIGTFALGTSGEYLIYARRDNTLQAVLFDARAERVTGTATTVMKEVHLGAGGAAKAALSASGTLVYVGGSREARLMFVGSQRPPRQAVPGTRIFLYPRLSPDDRRVAVTADAGNRSDVWIHDLQSGTGERHSWTGLTNDRAEWAPDGASVLYRTDADGAVSIVSRPIGLSEGPPVAVVAKSGRSYYEGVITPDGRYIVYQDGTAGTQVILGRSVTGDTTPFTISNSGAQARVSPRGRWVAYVVTGPGSQQVFVQPFPTGSGARVQVSQNGGTEPVWARDGSRLIYRGNNKFISATVVPGGTFSVATRDTLFEDVFLRAVAPHANYDVSRDGTRFLVIEAVESPKTIVVQRWDLLLASKLRGAP